MIEAQEGVVGSGSMRGLWWQQSLRNHRPARWFPPACWRIPLVQTIFCSRINLHPDGVVTACRLSDQRSSLQRTGEFCGSHCGTSVLVTDSNWVQTILLGQATSRFLPQWVWINTSIQSKVKSALFCSKASNPMDMVASKSWDSNFCVFSEQLWVTHTERDVWI